MAAVKSRFEFLRETELCDKDCVTDQALKDFQSNKITLELTHFYKPFFKTKKSQQRLQNITTEPVYYLTDFI